jgi:hypothetical protein
MDFEQDSTWNSLFPATCHLCVKRKDENERTLKRELTRAVAPL